MKKKLNFGSYPWGWDEENPFIVKEKCVSCAVCLDACPVNAIVRVPEGHVTVGLDGETFYTDGYYRIDLDDCITCGNCAPVCVYEAILIPDTGSGTPNPNPGTTPGGGGNPATPYQLWAAKAGLFLETKDAKYFDKIITAAGVSSGIQALNHASIKSFVAASGGAIEGFEVFDKITVFKKISYVSAVYDSLKTIVAFSDGDITTADWAQMGKTVLGIASFIPGPIGLTATGISIGIAVYEHYNPTP